MLDIDSRGFEVKTGVDLDDIQGNVVKAYGRYGLIVARYVFFHIEVPVAGRKFVGDMVPLVTMGMPWNESDIPRVTTNIGFTYEGLRHLDIPEVTLHGFPEAFSMGMKARREIIGDTGPSLYHRWDPVWNNQDDNKQHVHIMVTIDGKEEKDLDSRYQEIQRILAANPGVSQLVGHRGAGGDNLPYQPAAALLSTKDNLGYPGGKEHFGYSEGITTTFFEGCGEDPNLVIGGGKPTGGDPRTPAGWAPLAAGEFILGHPDEAFEYPEAPGPPLFSRNGTFIAYRKLHQNVGSFHSYLDEEGARFPDGKEALAAKFENYARYTPYLPAEAMTKLRALCFHARTVVQARMAFLDAKTPESTAETRVYFSAVCDDVANTATDVAKILAPLIASRCR